MPKRESVNQKIARIRPPRVHITYDVEVNGAMQMKELPFVVGVMGDFSGQPAEPLPRVRDRKFVQIDRDNFDQVLEKSGARVAISVDNKLKNDNSKLGVELNFKSMDDFTPDRIVQQVEPLRKLVELRQSLSDIMAKMDGNDPLATKLQEILDNADTRNQLGSQLGLDQTPGGEKSE